jgi:hypothetical protein
MKITQTELAKSLNVSRQLIWFHRKSGRTPKLDDIKGWKTFLAAHGRQGSAPTTELRTQIARTKLAILRETKHSKSRENKIEDGTIMDSGNVRRFVTSLVSLFFAHIDNLTQELPTALKGKAELEISEVLEKKKLAIVESLKAKMSEAIK